MFIDNGVPVEKSCFTFTLTNSTDLLVAGGKASLYFWASTTRSLIWLQMTRIEPMTFQGVFERHCKSHYHLYLTLYALQLTWARKYKRTIRETTSFRNGKLRKLKWAFFLLRSNSFALQSAFLRSTFPTLDLSPCNEFRWHHNVRFKQ